MNTTGNGISHFKIPFIFINFMHLVLFIKIMDFGNLKIYTIGYGNRSQTDFINILKHYHVKSVLDIRTSPYSSYAESFNKETLQSGLLKEGITYVFLGEKLGGRPNDSSCYDNNGLVDYEILENKSYYKDGINLLVQYLSAGSVCALMCSELKPTECHRSKLVGRTLDKMGIEVLHIDEKGKLSSQKEIMLHVLKGRSEINLFGEAEMLFSVKKYKK